MNKKLNWLSLLTLSLLFSACQKTSYLYVQPLKKPGSQYRFEHKLKEIQGESKVDILWIIDNSASMDPYQAAVAKNIASFMNEFRKSGLDWRIGLISTDSRPTYLKSYVGLYSSDIFDYKDPDPVARFQNAVSTLGTGGSGIEAMYIPVIENTKKFPNFVRKDAILALMVVTDAPEQSDRYYPPYITTPLKKTQDFLDYLIKLKGSLKRVVTYGAFGAQDLKCQQTDDFWSYKGSRYEEVVNATNGKYFPLCENDFGKELSKFGKDLLTRIDHPKIPLKTRPVTETIKVFYKDAELRGGPLEEGGYWMYNYEINAIIFHNLKFAASDNEKVTIEYLEST